MTSCNHAGEKVKPVEPDVPGGPWNRFDVGFAGTITYKS